MREILFRAKRLDNGEWVEGMPLETWWYGTMTLHICDGNFGGDVQSEAVDPSTLCQFTGLRDKNGERIWEGDILNYDGDAMEVFYFHASFMIRGGMISSGDDLAGYEERCIRLGSIHDQGGKDHA